MKQNIEDEKKIKTLFEKMNSKEDFLNLLNLSKKLLYKNKAHKITEKELNYYISKESLKFKNDKEFYKSFEIQKKSGGVRTIHAPVNGLLAIQKALNLIFQSIYKPHRAATGFIPKKSIVDNATIHTNKLYVYNIDLKDFFPSIEAKRVWGRLLVPPFNLGNSVERKKIANMIKTLCCHKMNVERFINEEWIKVEKSVLPQGAATSPILTNIICERLDILLSGLARRFKLDYTRYADDITFSSNHNTYKNSKGLEEEVFANNTTFDIELKRIINDQKFYIKKSKVRLQKKGFRQEVTGIVVNKKVNVKRKYIKDIRHNLYLWEKYGHDKCYELFLKKYLKEKGHIKKGNPTMSMVIEGKLLYLKMVKGENNATYLRLKNRFDKLLYGENQRLKSKKVYLEMKTIAKENTLNLLPKLKHLGEKNDIMKKSHSLHKIIDTIFEKGLDEAMKLYDN